MRRAASALLGRPGRGKDAVTWWKDWPDTQVAPRTCRRLATAAAPDARELGALPVRLCPTACCVSEPPILACVWSSDVCAFCSVSKQWPTKLEEVTPEWLTAQLQRAGVVPAGAAVRSVVPSLLPSGPLSCVHRLVVDADDGSQHHLVLKTAPSGAEGGDSARKLASASKVFEREVGFYKAMATERTPLALPRVFVAVQDSRSGCATLLLSDCEADGTAAAGHKRLPADHGGTLQPHVAIAVCRALASHHATFWGSTLIPLWRWLPDMNTTFIRNFEPALCGESLPLAMQRFGDLVPPSLRCELPTLPAAAAGSLLRRLASAPKTLLHGSMRAHKAFVPASLLHDSDEDSSIPASAVKVVDWGDAAAGRGPYDVACLLAASMEPEQRAEVEHSLMGEYHDALSEGGVTAYSMYDAWEDYKHGVTYTLVGAITAAGMPGLEHDQAAWDAARVRLQRAAEAASDLGCAALCRAS